MGDNLRLNTTCCGKWPLVEDDLWWIKTFAEDILRLSTTFGGRRSLVEDDLWWKTTFSGRQPSLDPSMLPTPVCGIFRCRAAPILSIACVMYDVYVKKTLWLVKRGAFSWFTDFVPYQPIRAYRTSSRVHWPLDQVNTCRCPHPMRLSPVILQPLQAHTPHHIFSIIWTIWQSFFLYSQTFKSWNSNWLLNF